MSETDLGTALAGVISRRAEVTQTRRGRFLVSSWLIPLLQLSALGVARGAAAGWHAKVEPLVRPNTATRHGIALELEDPLWDRWRSGVDPVWFVETLGSAEFVSAVHYVTARAHSPAEWLWPLDVGLFDDAESRAFRTKISQLYWIRFITLVSAEWATAPIGLLVFPHALRDALAWMLTHAAGPRVQAVLVLGGHMGIPDPFAASELLRGCARADAVCVTHISPDRHALFLDAILFELSHGLDLDVAIAVACRSVGARPPLMLAGKGAFASAHLSVWGHRVGARVARTPMLTVPPLRFINNGSPQYVGRELTARIADFAFDSERNEATLGRLYQ